MWPRKWAGTYTESTVITLWMMSWCLYCWLRMDIYSLQWHIQNHVKHLGWTRKTLYLTCSARFWIHLCTYQKKKTCAKNQIDKALNFELLTFHKLLMFFLSWKWFCLLAQLEVRIFKYGNKDISCSYSATLFQSSIAIHIKRVIWFVLEIIWHGTFWQEMAIPHQTKWW